MTPFAAAVTAGAVMVILFDTVVAALTRRFGWTYGRFVAGSFAIYAVTGSAAVAGGGVAGAALAGLLVALVDGTVGWWISWMIGPGRPPAEYRTASHVSTAVAVVVLTGAMAGALGGVIQQTFGG